MRNRGSLVGVFFLFFFFYLTIDVLYTENLY